MIFPADLNPTDPGSWGVVISYHNDGYVKDSDAASINYSELLQQIQKAMNDANPERIKQGYNPIQMIGWANPPHYDNKTHKCRYRGLMGARCHCFACRTEPPRDIRRS